MVVVPRSYLWGFGKLQMQFEFKEKFVSFQGLSSTCNSLIGNGEISKLFGLEH